jgi:prepilin-type N-terminal cleavage/methylation domain-containing protein
MRIYSRFVATVESAELGKRDDREFDIIRQITKDETVRFPSENSTRKGAFTLVELLVVIAIIGVLVALLLPAVQAAREAARRTQCLNNMKQLGLAIHNYHDAKNRLPQGSAYPGRARGRQQVGPNTFVDPDGGNWALQVLPYMELQNLYDQYDFDSWPTQASNAQLALNPISGFVCPSDSEKLVFDERGDFNKKFNPETSAGIWYVASIGPTLPDGGNPLCEQNGTNEVSYCNIGCSFGTVKVKSDRVTCESGADAFGDSSVGMFSRFPVGYNFREVSDGLSNTWMVGETIPSHNIFNALYGLNFPLFSTATPLNTLVSDEGVYGLWSIAGGAKSRHVGGANFVLGDASVRFVSETIDYRVFCELGTRAETEPASIE